ncbi:hypothetical protein [Endozoicomonas atrinae]|uniref:hypothetical protein n=1 Tax=Endozoicomonas atrinae TaxID=1333660 RepID=UPI003B0031F3
MATLIELEHSFLGKVRVAVMSLQSGEVYYEAEPIIKALDFPDHEKAFARLCLGSIRMESLDDYVVMISASDVRRLVSHCFDLAAEHLGRWLMEDARREALHRARQLPLF